MDGVQARLLDAVASLAYAIGAIADNVHGCPDVARCSDVVV
jgi:hypothetical protein